MTSMMCNTSMMLSVLTLLLMAPVTGGERQRRQSGMPGMPPSTGAPPPLLRCGDNVTGDTTSATHALGYPSGEVQYKFIPAVSGPITLSTCGSSFDTAIHLLYNDTLVATNDDTTQCGSEQFSRIDVLVSAGLEYDVYVEGFDTDSGRFWLALSCASQATTPSAGAGGGGGMSTPSSGTSGMSPPPDTPTTPGMGSGVPPTDSAGSGTGVTPMVPPTGGDPPTIERIHCREWKYGDTRGGSAVIGNPSPERRYKFLSTFTGSYRFATCGSEFDTFLRLYDSSGQLLSFNDDSEDCDDSLHSVITHVLQAGQEYEILVEGYALAAGEFLLELECPNFLRGLVNCSDEKSGDTRSGLNTLGTPAKEFHYNFVATALGMYTFDLCDSSYDTYLRIYDFNMTKQIARRDNGGCGTGALQSKIQRMLNPGEYVLVVEGGGSSEGDFELEVDCAFSTAADGLAYQGDVSCDEVVLGATSTGNNTFGHPAKEHTYSLKAEVEGIYVLDASESDMKRMHLMVLEQSSLILVAETNGSYLEGPLEVGNYIVVIEGEDEREGSYILELSCPSSYQGSMYCGSVIEGDTKYGIDGVHKYVFVIEAPGVQVIDMCDNDIEGLYMSIHTNEDEPRALTVPPYLQCPGTGEYSILRLWLNPGEFVLTIGGQNETTIGPYTLNMTCAENPPRLLCDTTTYGEPTVSGVPVPFTMSAISEATYNVSLCNDRDGNKFTGQGIIFSESLPEPLVCNGDMCCLDPPLSVTLPEGQFFFTARSHGGNFSLRVECPHTPRVRLTYPDSDEHHEGTTLMAGYVEVYVEDIGEWTSVCDPEWTVTEANMACQELGFYGGRGDKDDVNWDYVQDKFSEFECSDEDTSLQDCNYSVTPVSQSACEKASVIYCYEEDMQDDAIPISCGDTVVRTVQRQSQLFGLPGVDAIMKFDLTNTTSVVLDTCESDALTILWLFQVNTTDAGISFDAVDVCIGCYDGCGGPARLEGVLDAGSYVVVVEVHPGRLVTDGFLSLSMQCSQPPWEGQVRFSSDATGRRHVTDHIEMFLGDGWHSVLDEGWSHEDAVVACESLGFKGGSVPTLEDVSSGSGLVVSASFDCDGIEGSLVECGGLNESGLYIAAGSGGDIGEAESEEPLTAMVSCSDRISLSLTQSDIAQTQYHYFGMPTTMTVGGVYQSNPVNESIFENPATVFGSDRIDIIYSIEDMIDPSRFISDPGRFLVDRKTGAIVAIPTTSGLYGFLLRATDSQQFSTIVYSIEIDIRDASFALASSWNPDNLAFPNEVTVNQTRIYHGPESQGSEKTDIFVNFNNTGCTTDCVTYRIEFSADTGGPGPVYVNTNTGDFSMTPSSLGSFSANYMAVSSTGNTVIVKVWNFSVFEEDTWDERNGPHGVGCNAGKAVDDTKYDKNFTCDCTGLAFHGDNCDIANALAASSGSDDGGVSSQITIAVSLIAVLAAVILVYAVKARGRKLADARDRRYKIEYLQSLTSSTTSTKARVSARLRRFVVAPFTMESPTTDESSTEKEIQAELNSAMFIALEVQRLDFIPALIKRGAQASFKHPKTGKLIHTEILSLTESDVDVNILRVLFESHCEIDDVTGLLMSRKQRVTTQNGEELVLDVVRDIFVALAHSSWRSPDDNGGSVMHSILNACRLHKIDEKITMDLIEAVLAVDAGLLIAENDKGVSPTQIALSCHGCTEVEKVFTVVVFEHFQLVRPTKPSYKSQTSLIHECRDLRHEDDDEASSTLVIKLMRDESSWLRELEIRGEFQVSNADVVPVLHAATIKKIEVQQSHISVESFPGLDKRTRLAATAQLMRDYPYCLVMTKADRNLCEIIQNERLAEESIDVVRHCAFRIGKAIHGLHYDGIVHGDVKPRNIVREGANDFKMIDLDMAFHVPVLNESAPEEFGFDGEVSGEQLDSDTDFGFDSTLERRIKGKYTKAFNVAARDKMRGSTAYTPPEVNWYLAADNDEAIGRLEQSLRTPFRIDLWSFGVTLYELATGVSLLEHQYDKLTSAGLQKLKRWQGLDSDSLHQLKELYGEKESAALIDLLQWLLDKDPAVRPADMSGVMGHVFFNPKHGTMREHAAVNLIRELLDRRETPRLCKSVMISYCWADSNFVLNKLALELAPLVENLWLDRLGGEQGMGEWTHQSMERGVLGSQVILAVVSEKYINSKNCGFEMDMARKHNKIIIPLCLGIPFNSWPPKQIGTTKMMNQFEDPTHGAKLFVDFTDVEAFELKFNTELLPRLAKPGCVRGVRELRLKSDNQAMRLRTMSLEAGSSRRNSVTMEEGDRVRASTFNTAFQE